MLPSSDDLDPPKRDDRPLFEPAALVSLESEESLEPLDSPPSVLLEPPDSNEDSPPLLEAVVPVESEESAELSDVDSPDEPALEAIQSAPCVVSPLAL